jgi:hypothetical protein
MFSWIILSRQKFEHEIWHMKWRRTDFNYLTIWQNSRCTITVCHCVHCAKGKKGQRKFSYRLFWWITGFEGNMLLLSFVLGLFAKLAMVSGACELGTPIYNNFNWTRVCISVSICFLLSTAVKTGTWFYNSMWSHLWNVSKLYQIVISNNWMMNGYLLMIWKVSVVS